jgi:protein O-GlcNAc transferase
MNINTAYRYAIEKLESGNIKDAEYICKQILPFQQNNIDVLNLAGVIFYHSEKYDLSVQYFRRVLRIDPNNANAYYNLGLVLSDKGQFEEAIIHYLKSLNLNPNLPDIYNNLGSAYYENGQMDEALINYQKALHLNPDVDTYNNLGNLLSEQGKEDEALIAYNNALALNPNCIASRWGRCMTQLRIIYPTQSSIQISRKLYYDELINLRDTLSLDTTSAIDEAAMAVGSRLPFLLPYQGVNDLELQQVYGELVCRIMSLKYPRFAECSKISSILPGELLRIGMISSCFYNHSVWKIPIRGWIENLDKKRFALYGYHVGKEKDEITTFAEQCFNYFIKDIHSFDKLCKKIQEDKLHVIIYPEIGMDSMTLRLASLRLAPIQCISWGHPETSGLPTIDYFLSGELIETHDADYHYTEQLIRLPNISIYYIPIELPISEVTRETFHLRPKSILYHCCQLPFKFLPQYDEIYPRIAEEVSDCQFLFASYPESNFVNEQFQMRIRQAFSRFALDANKYVVFLPYLDTAKYNSLYSVVDIFLDPIGWSGYNSTLEAITCNLPVITLPTEFMRGRGSAAILTMIRLTETIASTLDEYVSVAVKMGRDSEWRKRISEKIAANKLLVYRDRTCISALEDFLEAIVKKSSNQ